MKKYYEIYEDRYRKVYDAGMSFWRYDHDRNESPEAEMSKTIDAIIANGAIPPPPCRLIDLGCGEGWWSVAWAERGYKVTGIDISPSSIAKAKELAGKKNLEIVFSVGNVLDLKEIKPDSFDIVFESQCFHHMVYDRDLLKCLEETFRILRYGGILISRHAWSDKGFDGRLETPEDVEQYMKPVYEQFHGRTYKQTYQDEKTGCWKTVEVDIIPARTKSKNVAIRGFESAGFRLIKVIGESCAIFGKR